MSSTRTQPFLFSNLRNGIKRATFHETGNWVPGPFRKVMKLFEHTGSPPAFEPEAAWAWATQRKAINQFTNSTPEQPGNDRCPLADRGSGKISVSSQAR